MTRQDCNSFANIETPQRYHLSHGNGRIYRAAHQVVERQLMLARRKNRSLSTAAQALWDVVRMQASELTAARARDPLYQL